MNVRHKTFSESTQCLTEDQLLLYMRNELNATEKHHIEKHLLECELCSDALDGLQLIESPQELATVFAELNGQLDERVNQKETRIIKMFPWWRIAAVLCIITIGGATMLYLQNESKKVENLTAETKQEITISSPGNFELKPSEPTLANENKSSDVEVKSIPTIPIKSKDVDQPLAKNLNSNDNAVLDLAAAETRDIDELPTSSVKSPITETVPSREKGSLNEDLTADTEKQKRNAASSENLEAPAALNKKAKDNYSVYQSNSAQIIDNGKFQMKNERYDSANYLFDQVINNNDTKYIEEALWNKAISLEKLNRIEDANQVLVQISNMNGNYKEKAKKKLKQNVKTK